LLPQEGNQRVQADKAKSLTRLDENQRGADPKGQEN
jgi:hypothetical protein